MEFEKYIEDYQIEFAVEEIAAKIAEKIKVYKETKDKNVQKELAELLEDREKIYCNDKDVIKKYLKGE